MIKLIKSILMKLIEICSAKVASFVDQCFCEGKQTENLCSLMSLY